MINLSEYGFVPSMMPESTNVIPARVTAVHKERYALICEHGSLYGKLKKSVYFGNGNEEFPTTGDFVLITYIPDGDSQIVKTLQRKSKFARNNFSGHSAGYVKTVLEQVVAANFDYVFILASLNLDFNIRRIERYLALAWQSGAAPVVILNKSDLVGNCSEQVRAVERIAPGVGVHAVSAMTGDGLAELSQYMRPCTTIVFLGSSGVGKSSLVNALAGEEIMAVSKIREDDSRGRHTTTLRQLVKLSSGAMVIDTPGMRELGMWDAKAGLGEAFSDVEAFLGKCRFSDCRHEIEPGCAVKEAIENGLLSEQRWESYLSLKREARFSEDKAGALREKAQRFKSIAKQNKQHRKGEGIFK